MCRNHSHVKGRIFSLVEEEGATVVRMLVVQPLTLETSYGLRLTLPPYTTLSVRLVQPDASLVSELHLMAAQAEPALFKEELIATSGPIIQPK